MTPKRTKKPQPRLPLTGYCPECDKIRYMTRAEARQAADRIGKRMRPYRCPDNDLFWHLASWQPQSRVAWYRDKETPDANRQT